MSYQIWVQDDGYAKQAVITTYKKLTFRQVLNDVGWASIEMHPDDDKIGELSLMRRLQIVRNGEIVFGGILLKEAWEIPEGAPADETWTGYALDHGVYAKWRVIKPPAGTAYDERTDHADDLAKAYVRAHCGVLAGERWFADLAVAPDQNLAPSMTERGRYGQMLSLIQKLADKAPLDWRFVPTATGCLFKTAYPHWGVDRTKGNGANDECVFSLDRRNFRSMDYTLDLLEHANDIYVGGQGEAEARTVVERSSATYMAAYKRREAFADARHLELVSSLQNYGDAEIEERKPAEQMTVQPAADSWKTLWDLGDLVTVYARVAGRTFEFDGKITAVDVTVSPENLETVTPTIKAV